MLHPKCFQALLKFPKEALKDYDDPNMVSSSAEEPGDVSSEEGGGQEEEEVFRAA